MPVLEMDHLRLRDASQRTALAVERGGVLEWEEAGEEDGLGRWDGGRGGKSLATHRSPCSELRRVSEQSRAGSLTASGDNSPGSGSCGGTCRGRGRGGRGDRR